MAVEQAEVTTARGLRPTLEGCGQALAHLRVAVVDTGVAALYCARLFAAYGAAVSVVGPPGRGDDDLAAWFRPGTTPVASLGQLDTEPDLLVVGPDAAAEAVARGAGRTVVLSLSWFASDGPYHDLDGSDEVIWAMSGVAFGIGEPDGPPVLPRSGAPRLLAGLNAFTAGLAALLHPPDRRPALVQVDVHETMALLAETPAIRGRDGLSTRSVRLGVNRFGATYPSTSYRSADGWIGLTCLTPSQWASVCELIGRDDLRADPRFVTSQARVAHADEVDALVAPAFAVRSTGELVARALELRLPLCPMPEPGELPHHEHWRARGSFAPVGEGRALAPTLPTRMGFTGAPVPRWGSDHRDGPLAGLRVADFTMGWAGPLAARLLADLGADVVKVEHHGHPDWWRGWDGPDGSDPPSTELQPNFNAMNRNKRGVSIDLRHPDGSARARELIASADVVLENFAAGVLTGLGLGPDVQRELNPDIISVGLPPFGTTGALAATRAYGTTVEQSSGLPFVNGRADWPPSLVHVALGDPVAGMYAGAAALVALAARARRGGSVVEVTQVECLFQLCAEQIIEGSAGAVVARTGNRRPDRSLSCVALSRDGVWVYAAVAGERAWEALCRLLDHPGWIAALATPEARAVSADDVEHAVRAWVSRRPADRAVAELRAIGGSAVVVRPAVEVGCDEQHEHCSLWGTLERTYVGRHSMARQPFRFDGRRPALRRAAPLLGQHTGEVLGAPGPVAGGVRQPGRSGNGSGVAASGHESEGGR